MVQRMILSVYSSKEIDGAVLRDLATLLDGGEEDSKRLHTTEYYAWKLLNDFGNSLVILAHEEVTLRPIGCITFTAKPSSVASNVRLFELGDVMVAPEARGAMLFVKMLRIGLDRLKTDGRFLVYGTPNDDAWPHEKRVGFRLLDNKLKYYGIPFPLISVEMLSRVTTNVLYLLNKIFFKKYLRDSAAKVERLSISINKKISTSGAFIDLVAQAFFYPFWLMVLLPFYVGAKINTNIRIVNFEKFDIFGPAFLSKHSFLLKNTAYLNWRYVDSPELYLKRALYNKNGLVAIYIFKELKFSNRSILYLVDAMHFQASGDSKTGLLTVIFTLPIYKYFSLVTMRSAVSRITCALGYFLLPIRSIKFIVFSSDEIDASAYIDFYAGDGDNI